MSKKQILMSVCEQLIGQQLYNQAVSYQNIALSYTNIESITKLRTILDLNYAIKKKKKGGQVTIRFTKKMFYKT